MLKLKKVDKKFFKPKIQLIMYFKKLISLSVFIILALNIYKAEYIRQTIKVG